MADTHAHLLSESCLRLISSEGNFCGQSKEYVTEVTALGIFLASTQQVFQMENLGCFVCLKDQSLLNVVMIALCPLHASGDLLLPTRPPKLPTSSSSIETPAAEVLLSCSNLS